MNPVARSVIMAKGELISRELDLLAELLSQNISDKSPRALQHAMCHAVQNSISAAVDIAQHILAEEGAPQPTSYTDSIEGLGRLGVLDQSFAARFARAAKLRNVVVHAYTELDVNRVVSLVPQLIADLKSFLRAVDSVIEP